MGKINISFSASGGKTIGHIKKVIFMGDYDSFCTISPMNGDKKAVVTVRCDDGSD